MDKPMTMQEVFDYYNTKIKENASQEEIQQLIKDNQRIIEKQQALGKSLISVYSMTTSQLERMIREKDLWISGKYYPEGSTEYAAEKSRLLSIIDFIEGLDQSN